MYNILFNKFKLYVEKIIFSFLICFIIFNTASSQSLFKSEKYKFHIRYPENWECYKGENEHLAFEIINDDNANINIVVYEDESLIGRTIDEIGIDNYIASISKSMKSKYSAFEVLEYYITYLDNQTAYYLMAKCTNKTLNFIYHYGVIIYQTFKGNSVYTITAGVDNEYFNYYKPIFINIISTFVFEE